jgi:hypothetical protein
VLENGGELLSEELGIREKHLRRKIMRVIKMKILGIGSLPGLPPMMAQPHPQLCDAIELRWTPPANKDVPVHEYVLQRRGGALRDPKAGTWTTIYVGLSLAYTDSALLQNAVYSYRVRSWNLLGPSEWSTLPADISPTEHAHCAFLGGSSWIEITKWVANLYFYGYHGMEILVALIATVCTFARANPHGHASKLVARAAEWFPTVFAPVREMTMYVASQVSPRHAQQGQAFLDEVGEFGSTPRGQSGHVHHSERMTSHGYSSASQRQNLTMCAVCNKNFKTFQRRKHHCGRCDRVFCGKCGSTSHLPFTPCQIPSKCLCIDCSTSTTAPSSGSGSENRYSRSNSAPEYTGSPPRDPLARASPSRLGSSPAELPRASSSVYHSQRPSSLALAGADPSPSDDELQRPASPRERWQYAGQEIMRQNREGRSQSSPREPERKKGWKFLSGRK